MYMLQEKRKTRLARSAKRTFKGSTNFIDDNFLNELNIISVENNINFIKVSI